jgi:hypothetical protein
MNEVSDISSVDLRSGERGNSKVIFVIVVVLLVLIANAAYNYVPVAYNDASFKQEMDTIVTQAVTMPAATQGGQQSEWAKQMTRSAGNHYDVPKDAVIVTKTEANGVAVRNTVTFHRKVQILPLGLYTYEYDFNYTAITGGFLGK